VDIIFMLVVFHFLRKLYLMSFSDRQENAWKSGAFLFLVLHGVIFFGLVLCCTHLSDITLTIAANVMNTLTFKYGKTYWFLFTDQTLNTDTIIRSMYMHYILGLVTMLLGVTHALMMHYDYKDNNNWNGDENENEWADSVFKKEIFMFFVFLFFLSVYGKFLYKMFEPLNYEIFMWGDVGCVVDVRFLGVAPHWYFRSYMSWLLLCPHHYFGVFGLIYLMVVIYFQTNLKRQAANFTKNFNLIFENPEFNTIHTFFFTLFIVSVLYTNTFLPYGRFFNMVGGNVGLLVSYLYVFTYLTFPLSNIVYKIYSQSCPK
jgi:quinol-cytochrome oxidoreductase complex cytochrome b subunit